MKVCILEGSMKDDGNTSKLVLAFMARLKESGHTCCEIWLKDLDLQPCCGCRHCQEDYSGFNCIKNDEMSIIFDEIMNCDLIVLATPIYSWYCTPPMKIVLDRMVYGMNKFYGEEIGPALWENKAMASIVSCGYKPEDGADLWEEGLKRYCKHSKLKYLSMAAERHLGYKKEFMDQIKQQRMENFADKLINELRENEQ